MPFARRAAYARLVDLGAAGLREIHGQNHAETLTVAATPYAPVASAAPASALRALVPALNFGCIVHLASVRVFEADFVVVLLDSSGKRMLLACLVGSETPVAHLARKTTVLQADVAFASLPLLVVLVRRRAKQPRVLGLGRRGGRVLALLAPMA